VNEIIQFQAQIMKTFAHPVRLQIIKSICKSEHSASEIIRKIKLSKSNLSQHMKMLTGMGIVSSRKDGVYIYYKLSNNKISKACELMQDIALDALKKKLKLLNKVK